MNYLTNAYIRLSKRFRDPDSTWLRYAWIPVVGACLSLLVVGMWLRKRRIASLEVAVETAELRAKQARSKSEIAHTEEAADRFLEEALRHKQRAKNLRGVADDAVMDYLEIDVKLAATKDWDALEEMYEDLD